MAIEILQTVQSFITPGFLSRASGVLGESPDRTANGIQETLPSLLMGIANKGSTQNGAEDLLRMMKEGGHTTGVPSDYTDHLNGGEATERYLKKGGSSLFEVFGSELGPVTSSLTESGGNIGRTTKLMSLLMPIALGSLGSIVTKRGMTASSLSSYLDEQRRELSSSTPKTELEPAPAGYKERPKHNWAPAAIALLVVIFGGYFLFGRRVVNENVQNAQLQQAQKQQAGQVPPQKMNPPKAPVLSTPTGDRVERILDPNSKAPLPQAVALTQARFAPGETTVPPEARPELQDVATALKAHPSAKISVVGSADPSGPENKNEDLSLNRAYAVKNELVANGVPSDQVRVMSMGSKGPQQKRRTDLLITQR